MLHFVNLTLCTYLEHSLNAISGASVKGLKHHCLGGSGLPYRDAKRMFDKFKPNEAPKPDTVRAAKERILTCGDSDIEEALELWKTAKRLDRVDDITLKQMEELAVFAYQEKPFVNNYFRKLYYSQSLNPRLKNVDKMHTAIDEAILVQSYLKKHQIPRAKIVYRFEPETYPDRFKVGRTFTEKTFLSTTKTNARQNLKGLSLDPRSRPREIEIRNLRVGADIEAVNPRYSHQKEILVPFGTKFRTVSIEDGMSEPWKDGKRYPIRKIVLEQVD